MCSVREYILEISLGQLADTKKVGFTKDRDLPPGARAISRNKISFNSGKGLLTAEIDSAALYGKYKDRPDYVPREVDFSGKTTKKSKKYKIYIWWPEWDEFMQSFIDAIKDMETDEDVSLTFFDFFEDMLMNQNVKVHCTCPSFHWMGIKKILKDRRAAIDTSTYPISPNNSLRRIKYVDSPVPLCKHLYRFINDAIFGKEKENTMLMIFSAIRDKLKRRTRQFPLQR